MSFPGPNQPPSNGGGNKPNGGNNPFTNPFSRNNDGKNGGSGANGNKSNGPRPFWQSPWLWVVVVALLAVTMFQLFAGAGSQTIDTKDGMQILNGNTVEYATIVDNTQQVKLSYVFDGRELFQTKDIKALTLAFDNETIEFVKSVVGRENLNIIWRSRLV